MNQQLVELCQYYNHTDWFSFFAGMTTGIALWVGGWYYFYYKL